MILNDTQKRLFRIVKITVLILLVPLLAMQFTSQIDWNLFDFAVAAALLIVTGLIYEFVVIRIANPKIRVKAGMILAIALLAAWVHLAVGIF
jgi:hypothetical protein